MNHHGLFIKLMDSC